MSRWDISRAGGLVRHQDGRLLLPLTLTAPGGTQEQGALALDPGEAELLYAQLSHLLDPVAVPLPPELGGWTTQ